MNKFFIIIFALFLFFQGCGNDHFLVDSNYRSKVEQRFELKKQLAGSRSEALFGVFNSGISTQEAEALKFLYAYMPLSDLADYDGSFYLKLVQSSFKARETFSWGRQVPEDIFRHFVLPYRVNNENLDSARWVFYGELKERLKGMSMKQAALEVNHWCHEKVIYQPTDGRTSAPLSTVKTSYGRCGEESTFLVTALRAAAIPARQVYTPRWAHCDDNHAWVEVWIDGKWNYMGACEPEADLNIAWFTAPAKRAMLVHTKVFGDYAGSEEVVRKTEDFTEINVTSNYADVKKIFVRVVDQSGKPAVKASVDFGLYNYAEFYPIASKLTDTHGTTFLTTGFGDLLVSASQNGMSGFKKISVGQTDTLEVKLESHRDTTYTVDMDFYPPVEKTIPPADEQMQKANSVRLHQEDSIRTIYRATFIDSAKSALLAEQSGLDKKQLVQLMKAGMGNWMELKAFVERNRTSAHIFPLLNAVSAKDLRDTRAEILEDHLRNTLNSCKPGDYENPELFYSSVLNPRVRNENLTAYRKLLHDKFSSFASADRDLSAGKIV
ncbi:MAG: transglutaminase-like domain-containing protein, partial [Methanococcaceae archaeon]